MCCPRRRSRPPSRSSLHCGCVLSRHAKLRDHASLSFPSLWCFRAQEHTAESDASIQRLQEAFESLGAPEAADAEAQCNLRGRGLQSQFRDPGKAPKDGTSSPSKRPPPPTEFKFLPRDRKVKWKLLKRVNVKNLVRIPFQSLHLRHSFLRLGASGPALQCSDWQPDAPAPPQAPFGRPPMRQMRKNDTTTVCQLMEEVMYADIDSESVFNLTEGNLIKLFQLAQLMLEFVNHERVVLEHQYDDFLENRELVLQLLERAGVTTLDDIRDGTEYLGRNFTGLAGGELEDMFSQVRVEERAMSRMVLAGAIEETKRRYESEVEEEQRLGQEQEGSEGGSSSGGDY